MQKKALGKGLGALIPERLKEVPERGSADEREDNVSYINLERIKPNPFQPRENFDKKRLDELISSIKEKGVLQPVIVRYRDDGYELIAGERRLRAARELGMGKVPVIVKDASDRDVLELSLIENIQREELNPIEEAKAFKRLIDEFEFSQEDVAKAVGKDRTTISNTMRLLGLPKRAQEMVVSDELSMGHARALLALAGEHTILKLANRILRKGLSVRETENIVAKRKSAASSALKADVPKSRDHKVMFFEEELQRSLGTKVKIQHGKKRGRVQIDYYSLEDLERIYNLIKK